MDSTSEASGASGDLREPQKGFEKKSDENGLILMRFENSGSASVQDSSSLSDISGNNSDDDTTDTDSNSASPVGQSFSSFMKESRTELFNEEESESSEAESSQPALVQTKIAVSQMQNLLPTVKDAATGTLSQCLVQNHKWDECRQLTTNQESSSSDSEDSVIVERTENFGKDDQVTTGQQIKLAKDITVGNPQDEDQSLECKNIPDTDTSDSDSSLSEQGSTKGNPEERSSSETSYSTVLPSTSSNSTSSSIPEVNQNTGFTVGEIIVSPVTIAKRSVNSESQEIDVGPGLTEKAESKLQGLESQEVLAQISAGTTFKRNITKTSFRQRYYDTKGRTPTEVAPSETLMLWRNFSEQHPYKFPTNETVGNVLESKECNVELPNNPFLGNLFQGKNPSTCKSENRNGPPTFRETYMPHIHSSIINSTDGMRHSFTVGESNALTEEYYVDLLAKKLKDMTPRKLIEQSLETFFPEISKLPMTSQTLCFADLSCMLDNSFNFLQKFAQEWEKLFDDHICLPNEAFYNHLEIYKNWKGQINKDLPEKVKSIIQERFEEFAKEYEERNVVIQNLEEEAMLILVRKAADYYSQEMKLVIGDRYFDQETLNNFHKEIWEETRDLFLNSAAFKSKHWERMYLQLLEKRGNEKLKIRSNLHEFNKKILESRLYEIKENCLKLYTINLKNHKARQEMTSELFDDIDERASTGAFEDFLNEINTQIGNQNQEIIQRCKDQLAKDVRRVFNKEKMELMELLQRKKVDLVKRQKDDKRNQVDLVNRQEDEKRNQVDVVKRQGDEKRKQVDLVKRQEASTIANSHLNCLKTSRGRGKTSRTPKSSDDHDDVEPGYSVQGKNIPTSSKSLPTFSLPPVDLAIHLGLQKSVMGIFLPGTKEFKLLANVDTSVIFEAENVVKLSSDEIDGNASSTNFGPWIIDEPVDKTYYVDINDTTYSFRIEDFISYLFVSLKWRAERVLLMRVDTCVICVPQCLNEPQRIAVLDAANLAGFNNVKMINDTNAAAFAYMMEDGVDLRGDIAVANTCEGFIDATYFNINKGNICRKAVSGKYFTPITSDADVKNNTFSLRWLKSFFTSSSDPLHELIKDTLTFKCERKNQKAINCKNCHLVIVGVGDSKYTSCLVNLVKESFGHIDCVSHTLPLRGAAYFARLRRFDPLDPICAKWLEFNDSRKGKDSVGNFIGYLLSPVSANCDKFMNFPLITKGVNLNPGTLKPRFDNFFLKLTNSLHSARMDALQYAVSLKHSVKGDHIDVTTKVPAMKRVDKIVNDLQFASIDLVGIELFVDELQKIKEMC